MVKQTKGRNKDGGIVKPTDTPALDDRGRSYLRGDSKTARQKEEAKGQEEAVTIRLLTEDEAQEKCLEGWMDRGLNELIIWLYSHDYVIGRKT